MTLVSICYCHSQVLEQHHIFKGFSRYWLYLYHDFVLYYRDETRIILKSFRILQWIVLVLCPAYKFARPSW